MLACNNINLLGSEQTVLNVIAWVRSQVYLMRVRTSRYCLRTYVYLFIGCWLILLVGWMVWYDILTWLIITTYKCPPVWVNTIGQIFNTWLQENWFISSKWRDQLYVTLNQRFWVNDVENVLQCIGKINLRPWLTIPGEVEFFSWNPRKIGYAEYLYMKQ